MSESPANSKLIGLFLGLLLIVPVIAFSIVQLNGPDIRKHAFEGLDAIAKLKAEQIENWLAERQSDAELLAAGEGFAQHAQRLVQTGNAESRAFVLRRLEAYGKSRHYDAAALLNASGQVVVASGEFSDASAPVLRQTFQTALKSGRITHCELHRDAAGLIHFEYAIPLPQSAERPPLAVVVLHSPPERFLFPLIQAWPTPSPSAETLLVRRDGNEVLFLNELRHRQGAALSLRIPLSGPQAIAVAAILSGKAQVMEGEDYRGVTVFAATRPIAGTTWHVAAKIDREEVLAPLKTLVYWISLVTLIAVAAIGLVIWRLWRQMRHTQRLELANGIAETVREQKEFLDAVLESEPECVKVIAPNGAILQMNRAGLAMLEVDSLLEAKKSGLLGFVLPEHREAFAALSQQVFGGKPGTLEFQIEGSKGTRRWLETHATPLRNSAGEVTALVGVTRDVSESKKLLEALRQSEERFRTVADYTFDWEYWLGPNREILYMSPSCERVTGYAPAEFAADPELFRRIVLPTDRNLVEAHLNDDLYHEEGQVAFRIVRRDGAIRWITHRCRAVYGANRQFMGRRVSNRDETERRQAEEALHLTRYSLEVASDALFWISPDARIVDVNAAACRSLGYTREELLQLRVPDMDPHYNEELWPQHFAELRQRGSMTFESEHRTKDGRLIPVEIAANHVVYGSEERNCAFVRDITARKLVEQELKRSNAELEQFSYAISHDMRQPLRMISSYLQLLEKGLAGQLDASKQEFFHFAIDGAKRLDRMLVGLLDYSRVGRKGEPPDWIESRVLLDEALLFLQPAIAEAQAELKISGDWPRVFVSPDEMMRLLQNLIGNAVKYRVAGRKPEITVTSETVGNEWRLSVADNGVGVLPDQAHRLFQVFQRLQSQTAYEGTGIGLALCRKIAERHGGRIGVSSSGEGSGSTFWVKLPLVAPDAAKITVSQPTVHDMPNTPPENQTGAVLGKE